MLSGDDIVNKVVIKSPEIRHLDNQVTTLVFKFCRFLIYVKITQKLSVYKIASFLHFYFSYMHQLQRKVVVIFLIFNHRKNLLCPLDFRYYLSSAGCLYVCIYLSIYVCLCDCSHTVQRRALKLWHNIPHVTI